MSDTDTTEAEQAYQDWLLNQDWTFAKTMADNPHEYIVRTHSAVNTAMYEAFDTYIEREGYDEVFQGYTYRVIDIGDYKYWTLGKILNRKAHAGYDVLAELDAMGVDPSAYVDVSEHEDTCDE